MKHKDYTDTLLSMFEYYKVDSLKEMMAESNMKRITADSDQIIRMET